MTLVKNLSVDDEFSGYYLLKEFYKKQTNSSPPRDYFDILLCDSSGELPSKYWNVMNDDKESFIPMEIVKVEGIVQIYRDKLQARIIKIRKATEEDNQYLTDLVKMAPINSTELMKTIRHTADSIQDLNIKKIVSFCIDRVGEKLMNYPAAKTYHHAYQSGLAYHIVRMLEVGEFLCKQRPFLNADLLKAGIILHDIAKTEEMNAQLGVVKDYSNQGKLIGHISLACNWIIEAAIMVEVDIKSEQVLTLQHLVLSHHNLGEWGSPVQPQMAEAVALHYIDLLDAKLQMVEDALDMTTEAEEWTPCIKGLENKAMYRLKI
ncbi:3'-5' exoribonuclease YhaM [Paenibacillus chitinolyticus]|uniref:3'-5' exoribonuclease YhaM family protein n=1 Tax=Paenibacillus chitinolyticus TaxID=79263 RepID=UPI0026E4FEF1|nr:HD domain-containing protein [Paenibacillus chitinolyticus]GKS13753.1 3'-5' exoribonuclease YhaM [Paenibacillus chitinolyticus]